MQITNRVAESDIATFDLEKLWDGRPVQELDLAPFLVESLVLREKPFREAVKAHAWEDYDGTHVAVFCSTDAIIPTWAPMLVASRLEGHAVSVSFGREGDLVRDFYVRALEKVDWAAYAGKPVVIKGCSSAVVPADAYLIATSKLQQVAKKLMYGEACSAVPLWRRPKEEAPATPSRPLGVRPAGPSR